ncbi:MAG: TonB-dependent receptor plug domain-containing protein [Caulobacteraceae bacterium]
MALSVFIAAAVLASAPVQTQSDTSGSEAQGPPTTTPLLRQSGPVAPPPSSSRPSVVTSPAQAPPGAAAAGQPASGVLSYPASFFAAAQPSTARDMINRLPGFTFDDGASVRGFEGAAGNVLIDGELPTSKSDDIGSVLRRIPASQVARIDLIRGGAPGIDMHGKVLVANVVRTSGPSSTALLAVSNQYLTSDGRQAPAIRLEGTQRRDGTSLEGSFVIARFFDDGAGDGPVTQVGPNGVLQGVATDNTKAGGYQAIGTGAYEQPLLGGKFRVNVSLQNQPYFNDEIVGTQGGTAIAPSLEHDHQNTEQGEIGLHYSRDFGPKLSLEMLAIQQLDGEDSLTLYSTPGEDDRFREQHTNGETIGRSVLTWRPLSTLTIEGGAEMAYNWLTSHTNYTTNGLEVVVPAANVSVDELRGEAFAKATWAPSSKLNIEAGLRMEVSHIGTSGDVVLQKTLEYPKPRLAVAWSPTAEDQIRLRLEREVGQLDFNDFVAASSLSTGQILAGNPNLTPQQAWVVEAAYERRFLKDGAATLTVRHSALSDVIDRAPVFAASGAYDAPANIGGGSKDELIGDLSLPLQRFGVTGGLIKTDLTWRRSQVTDPTTGESRPISGLKPFEGTVDFSQDLPHWKLSWGGELNVGWSQRYYRYDQIETDTLSPTGQLFIEVKPKPGWAVRVEARDIGLGFDRKLANWNDVRNVGVAFDNLDDRDLKLGPIAYLRVRRNW